MEYAWNRHEHDQTPEVFSPLDFDATEVGQAFRAWRRESAAKEQGSDTPPLATQPEATPPPRPSPATMARQTHRRNFTARRPPIEYVDRTAGKTPRPTSLHKVTQAELVMIEQLIERNRIDTADRLMQELLREYEQEPFSFSFHQLLMQALALPLQRWSARGLDSEPKPELQTEIEAVHGYTGEVLRYYLELERDTYNPKEPQGDGALKGATSEATVFGLLARGLSGTTDDTYIPFPAGYSLDGNGQSLDGKRPARTPGSKLTSTDLLVVDRADASTAHLQIKTVALAGIQNTYADHILLVGVNELAPTQPTGYLAAALVDELDGRASLEQRGALAQATEHLHQLIVSKK